MLTKKKLERLAPFVHRKSARQRLILYLLADGYSVADLTKMDVATLRAITLPLEMDVRRDEILSGRHDGYAFVYDNGSRLPHTNYYRLVRQTAEKVLRRPMSQEKFRSYINKPA